VLCFIEYTVISLSRLGNLHCRGGLGLCLEFVRALSGERLGSKLADCDVSFPDLSSEELAQVKVEVKRLRAEGAWPLDPWDFD
jgi:AMMECR1 domain-containing protein